METRFTSLSRRTKEWGTRGSNCWRNYLLQSLCHWSRTTEFPMVKGWSLRSGRNKRGVHNHERADVCQVSTILKMEHGQNAWKPRRGRSYDAGDAFHQRGPFGTETCRERIGETKSDKSPTPGLCGRFFMGKPRVQTLGAARKWCKEFPR